MSESGQTPALPAHFPYWDFGRDQAIQYGVLVITILLVLAPLVPILYQSFLDRSIYDHDAILTLSNFVQLLKDPGFRETLGNTLIVAIASTAIAQIVGGVVAAVRASRAHGARYVSANKVF